MKSDVIYTRVFFRSSLVKIFAKMIYYCENSLAIITDNSKEVESTTADKKGKYNNTITIIILCFNKSYVYWGAEILLIENKKWLYTIMCIPHKALLIFGENLNNK